MRLLLTHPRLDAEVRVTFELCDSQAFEAIVFNPYMFADGGMRDLDRLHTTGLRIPKNG